MTSSVSRSRKYRAKVRGDVSKLRLEHYRGPQIGAFRQAMGGQVHIERLVKTIISRNTVMVSLNHFYMNFGKKLNKLRKTYSAATLQTEVCIEFEKWNARGLDNTVLDEIVVAMGFENCFVAPPVCAWSWKRKLTFSGNVSATDLDDFPVLVHLTVANFDFNKAQDLGEDIRFMDSDTCPSDGTPLKHEIELWDKGNNQAWVWVKVPRIDGGSAIDFIYMFYGNGVVADGQDAANVWDTDYLVVHHLRGNGTTNLPDSTAPANDATKVAIGEPANFAAGKADGAQASDGNDDYVGMLDNKFFDSSATVSIAFKPYYESYTTAGILWAAGNDNVIFIDGTIIRCRLLDAGGAAYYAEFDTGGFDTDHWYVVCFRRDGSTSISAHLDGVKVHSIGGFAGPTRYLSYVTNELCCYMPTPGNRALFYIGKIDEVRVSTSARSDDWIMAQWKSQDETLITYGAEAPA